MPTWPQRWCKDLGPGLTYADYIGQDPLSVECSGEGQCDESGSCVCEAGYGGAACSQPALPRGAVPSRATELF
eukprot:2343957-Prymnesium_polylepis.1